MVDLDKIIQIISDVSEPWSQAIYDKLVNLLISREVHKPKVAQKG